MSSRTASIAAGIALAAACVAPVLLHPAYFFQDDSYFYLQIAANIAEGHGSTFHGVTPTNGYHPLWMIPCVAAQALAGSDRTAALYVTMLMQVGLFVVIALAWLRACTRLGIAARMPGLALLGAYFLCIGLYGSEAHLNGAMLLLALLALLRADGADRLSSWAVAGAVGGFAVLARLDNVFVIGALLLAFAVRGRAAAPRAVAIRLAAAGSAVTLTLLPYLAWNASSFGHLMPISGAIKSTFPHPAFALSKLGTLGLATAALALAALLFALVARRDPIVRTSLGGLAAGVLLHAAYITTFTDHYTYWHWYYVPGVVSAALFMGAALDAAGGMVRDPRWSAAVRTAGALATAGLVIGGMAYAWLKAFAPPAAGPVPLPVVRTYRWADELAVWMRDALPEGSVVFAYDYPGTLAYRSRLRILPADGLVNDFAYDRALRDEGLAGYLCSRGVTHYFGADVPEGGTWGPRGQIEVRPARGGAHEIALTTPLTRAHAGGMTLPDAARVVRVRDVVRRPDDAPPLAIWRLDAVCGAAALDVPSGSPARAE